MIDWLFAVHVVKKTPVRKRSTAIGQTEFAGASASSVVLKPAEPRTSALQLALAKVGREQRTRESAEPEGGAERAEDLGADVQRVRREDRHEHVEVEPDGRDDGRHQQDEANREASATRSRAPAGLP